jgi:hypothetical protein
MMNYPDTLIGTKAHSTNKPKQTTRSTTEICVQAIGSNVNINSDAKMEPYVKQMNSDSPTIGNDQTSGNNLGSESDGMHRLPKLDRALTDKHS